MNDSQGKHILFIVPSAYTLGGLATWLNFVVPGLRELGWNVTLGLVEGARYHRPNEYLKVHSDQRVVRIKCTTGTELGRRKAVERKILQLQPDIVATVNIPDGLAAVANLRSQGLTDCKAVMTCHGIETYLYADMHRLQESIDAVVCTNKLACHLASDLGNWDSSNVYHAPYGVDLIENSRREKSDRFTIAYVGRIEQDQKLVFDLPGIVEGLREKDVDFELLIAGDGPDTDALKSKLSKWIPDHVDFLGRVPPEDLSERVYSKVDAMIMPSLWETGPIVIWEAMTHRVAVVSSKYIGSGLESLLEHDENCLLYEINDCGEAANQLARLATDKELLDQISNAGWKTIESKLTKKISTQNWSNIFESILERPNHDLLPLESCYQSKGRLTSLLGIARAEKLRSFFGKIGPDVGPGGEWPHRLAGYPCPESIPKESAFWEYAKQNDKRETVLK